MISLVLKETQALAAYWGAFALLGVANLVFAPFDGDALRETQSLYLEDWSMELALVLVLSMMVGHGAVASEHRERHIEFLDGLPISRWQVYGAKVVACLAPCVFLVCVSFVVDLAQLAMARPPHAIGLWQPLILAHVVMLAGACGGLGLGMLLSWLGPLAWGLFGLSLVVGGCAGVVYPPVLVWVPIVGSLGSIDWQGTTATHPVGPLVGLFLLCGGSIGVSGLLFLGPGQALVARGSWLVASVRWGMAGCLGLLLVPLGLLTAVGLLVNEGARMWAGVDVVESEHFRVLYAPGDEARAREVAREVDALSAEVGRWVGHDAPLELDIELLDTPKNHLGAFTGGKIRYLGGRDTLAHELAHAHARAVAGAPLSAQDHATQFFNEGLANWVQAKVTGGPEVSPVAGAIWRTNRPELEEIVDRDRLAERYDPRVAYELGQAFVAALADVGGDEAPGCVLRALSKVGEERVAALALWYGLATDCGIDLDEVRARWGERLDAVGDELPATLPRLRARVDREEGELVVRDEAERGWPLRCGFRDDEQTQPEHQVYLTAKDGRCPIPYGRLSGSRFQYAVGFVLPGGDDAVFLPWTEARL